MVNEKIHAFILAGGKSLRMGADKGLLDFNGKAVIQHVIEALELVTKKITIVTANKDYARFGKEIITDTISGIGPAGGIHAALEYASTERLFVTSCDMPFITGEAVEFIINQAGSYDITIPLYKEKIEPMLGLYSKSCRVKWEEGLHKKTYKLQDLISFFNSHLINVNNNPLFGEKIFTNINTREQLEEALKDKWR